MTVGVSGFRQRVPEDDDPVVCSACGTTLGNVRAMGTNSQVLTAEQTARRLVVQEEHKEVCLQIQAHMRKHRTLDGPCDECGNVYFKIDWNGGKA